MDKIKQHNIIKTRTEFIYKIYRLYSIKLGEESYFYEVLMAL